MALIGPAMQFINNPRTREFFANQRNNDLLSETARDLPGMWKDRGMLLQGKNLKFAAHHNELIRLADNNRGLVSHLAEATGNPILEKAASWPTMIHLAAENPTLTRLIIG